MELAHIKTVLSVSLSPILIPFQLPVQPVAVVFHSPAVICAQQQTPEIGNRGSPEDGCAQVQIPAPPEAAARSQFYQVTET